MDVFGYSVYMSAQIMKNEYRIILVVTFGRKQAGEKSVPQSTMHEIGMPLRYMRFITMHMLNTTSSGNRTENWICRIFLADII